MILSAHVVVGAGIGVATNDPLAGITAAIASHYVLDLIPHREYSVANLRTGSVKTFAQDLSKVFLDLAVGLITVVLLTSGNMLALAFGLLGALPDVTTFLCILLKRRGITEASSLAIRLLRGHLAFHKYIHSIFMKNELRWRTAITTQIIAIGVGSWMLLRFL